MTLDEIFKDQPELLNEPAVKKLVEYVSERHHHNTEIAKRHLQFYNDVFDVVMYSDFVLIDGTPCDQSIEKIMTLIENV